MKKKGFTRSGRDAAALAVIVVWVSGLAEGCGKADPPATELEGEWVGPCQVDSSSRSFQVHLSFAGSRLTRVAMNFTDPYCHMLSSASKIVGEFRLGESVPVADGARKMDTVYFRSSATPATSISADEFNRVALCGFHDWLVNNEKDVTGALCGQERFPRGNSVEFGIVRREGGSLRLGASSESGTGRSEASRYATFDALVYTHED